MKRFHAHIRSREAALQQRPKILKAVCVDSSVYIFLGMVDYLMLVVIAEALVRMMLISVERRSSVNRFANLSMQGFAVTVLDDLRANLPTTFQHSHNDRLAESATLLETLPNLLGLVHVSGFATDERFIGLYFASRSA